jgi:hypothetical protein
MASFGAIRVDIIIYGDTDEIGNLGRTIFDALKLARWKPKLWTASGGAVHGVRGVPIEPLKGDAQAEAAAPVLARLLTANGVASRVFPGFEGKQIPATLEGPPWNPDDIGTVRVLVGAKP